VAVSITVCAGGAGAASASSLTAHGQKLHLVPSLRLNANQSNNWFGYNQGALEQGGKLFNSISGQWTVPTATQHIKGQQEFSSSWLGIGGGCLDTSCSATDSTLIQAGTEQDVDSSGKASYSTWYELIPAPSISTPLAVKAGDVVSSTIAETVPEVWSISLKNVTTGQSWSTTVPYSSSYATAEWIEETPLTFGTGGAGLSSLPNLGTVTFDLASVNGANAALNSAEEMQLVDSNGNPIATPSAPDAEKDGFNDCTWSSTC
jgi:hypothetical protein